MSPDAFVDLIRRERCPAILRSNDDAAVRI